MKIRMSGLVLAVAVLFAAAPARAQFEVGGKKIQIHGFFSQGFVLTDKNNFLTMKTSDGSAAFTDGGMNISTKLTNKFRVGAQAYTRNIGELSNGRVELDWAYGDYRFNDWLGIRAGKVKSTMGLYNDTQDMEFLHAFALLPQSVYPTDLRASNISHRGGDIYGDINGKKAGTFSYVFYGGLRSDDPRGGYRYGLADGGIPVTGALTGYRIGGDVRWQTPLEGLLVGATVVRVRTELTASLAAAGNLPLFIQTPGAMNLRYYGEYQKGGLKLAAEYGRDYARLTFTPRVIAEGQLDTRGWYVSGSYKLHPRLEAGAYRGQYVYDAGVSRSRPDNHIDDTALVARFNLKSFWNVKVEGHFMDGYGNPAGTRSFYRRTNPQGLAPRTNMLILRTGVNF